MWTELHAQVTQLRILRAQYDADISIDEDLPEEYFDAILRFKFYLEQFSKGPLGQLKHDVVASPPLRAYFVREIPPDATSYSFQVDSKTGIKFDKVSKQLMILLHMLWENGQDLFFIRLTTIVDELERLMPVEPKAKALVSAHIASVLANLSVSTEAIRQLSIYQPWAQTFANAMVDKEEGIEEAYDAKTQHLEHFMGVLDGPGQHRLVTLGDPRDRKFYYPVDKRRTKENVEAMRLAEQNLDAFWIGVDDNLRRKAGNELDVTALKALLSASRNVQRTSRWDEPAKNSKITGIEALTKPLSELYFELEHRTERTVDRSRPAKSSSAKAKTRGLATSQDCMTEPEELPPSALLDDQPTFPVDARALKVFRTLFYTPSASATPGEVPWTDFLHAMSSVGFLIEKLYGSVWQFQPTKLDVERGIQFHEPHPKGKIPYRHARRHGRRLQRAYGWLSEMFVLQEVAA